MFVFREAHRGRWPSAGGGPQGCESNQEMLFYLPEKKSPKLPKNFKFFASVANPRLTNDESDCGAR